ncbi:MAG: ATP-binding cassette domain-containing protein, partial [Nanoarchaeota archaeon]|nr:ATP-binding cassette domain-containing protein [Nanoarchaeota archaeon]
MGKEDKALIDVENVSKSFNNKILFEDVNFSVYDKEILGILGYSGEGKSSLLNILTGVESIDTGSVKYHYKDKILDINSCHNSFIKELIGYSTQEPSI